MTNNPLLQKQLEEKLHDILFNKLDYCSKRKESDGNYLFCIKSCESKIQLLFNSFHKETIESIIEMAEGMKKVCGGDLMMNDELEQCRGYNQALTDLLKKLK